MVETNSRGEVCDVLDVSQFIAGRSAYECVAYSGALLKYAGLPGHGATGTALQASNLAQYWYGKEEGSTGAANTNGMSVPALDDMLNGMGLHWTAQPITYDNVRDTARIRLCLEQGTPCIVCGAESSFFDVALGDRVPYNWQPTGNHAIVVSGIAPDGNLLVHDTANVDAQGHIRPGPRTYDASHMQLVSITAVQIGGEEDMIQPLTITQPAVATLFEQLDSDHWKSRATGRILHDALLKAYVAGGQYSLDYLGDVISPEIPLSSNGSTAQFFTSGARMWNAATGKVEPFAILGTDGQAVLRRLLAVPAPAPEVPQERAFVLQVVEQGAALLGKKLV